MCQSKRDIMIEQLVTFFNTHGRLPRNKDYNNLGLKYGQWSIVKEFGSWNNYLSNITDRVTRNTYKLDDDVKKDMIQQGIDYYNKHELQPSERTFKAKDGYRWTKQPILNVFGSWNNYTEECGLGRYNGGSRVSYRSDDRLLDILRKAIDSAGTVDRDVLALYNIPSRPTYISRFGSWSKAVELSGYTINSSNFGTPKISNDGHECDSIGEYILDNWLYSHNILHEIHVKYPVEGSNGSTCDFICGNIYIEYTESQYNPRIMVKYITKLQKKREWCRELGVTLVEIDSKKCINDVLNNIWGEVKQGELLEGSAGSAGANQQLSLL